MSEPLFNGLESGIDCVKIDGEEYLLHDGEMKITVDNNLIAPGVLGESYVTVEISSESEIFKK